MKTTAMRHAITALLTIALLCPAAVTEARKITTKKKAPRTSRGTGHNCVTIERQDHRRFRPWEEKVLFHGYDKTASASRESFFVSNNTSESITGMTVEISYFTENGKLLHRRIEKVAVSIPAGETRKIEIATWDSQGSFRYHKSAASRRATTPYTVSLRLMSVSTYRS